MDTCCAAHKNHFRIQVTCLQEAFTFMAPTVPKVVPQLYKIAKIEKQSTRMSQYSEF